MTALKIVSKNDSTTTAAKSPALPVPITILPQREGAKAVLDVGALEPGLRKKVDSWYDELRVDMVAFGKAGLKIGRVLAEARATLKPLGVWGAFLNRIPGMSGRTGERFIKRYEMARKTLPESVLALAVTSGVDIAGSVAEKPFGRYTGAVRKVGAPPRDTGRAEYDTERARVWLGRVLVVQAREKAAARKRVDPTARASEQLVGAVERYAEEKRPQITFLSQVLKRTLKSLGWGELLVMQSAPDRDGHKKAA